MADMTLKDDLKGASANKQQAKDAKTDAKQVPRVAKTGGKSAKNVPKKPTPEQNAYEKLLGQFVGGKLYGIVNKELSRDKVLEYADQAVLSLMKVMESEAGKAADKSGMSADDKQGAKAFAGALGSLLHEKAAALLNTPAGKRFASKVSKYTKTHPVEVLSLVLAAAAVAVASNASLPALNVKQKVGHGLSVSAQAKLGKVRDIALEAAKLQLAYQKGLLEVKAGVQGNKKGLGDKHVEVRYGTKRNWVHTMADIDAKGVLTASLGGGYGITKNTEVKADVTEKAHKIDHADARVEYKGKHYDLASALSYSPKNDQVRLDMGMKKGKKLDISAYYARASRNGKTAETYGGAAKFSIDDLKIALDGQFQTDSRVGSGSVKVKKGRMEAGAGATYDGRLGELTHYYAYFGFKDPKTFEEYLVRYKHDKYPDYSMDEFSLKLQHAIHGLVGTVQADTRMKNGDLNSGSVSGRLAYKVNKDIAVFGGVAQGFGPERQHGTMPFVGVEVKKVPVWVGYDTNSKGVAVGFTFRF